MARRISSPILIGRELEVQAFRLALQEAADRRPGLILIGGEAGIGKSRLVSEYARLVRTSGGIAAIGAAPPPAGDVRVPLAALVAVLRGLLRAVDARLLDRILGPARLDLAALLPELGGVPADAPSPYPSTRLAEAVLVAIESVAQRSGPLLVVIEDLHWADDATRAVLMYTCRNLVDAPVVTVVTHRTDAYPAAGDIVSLLAEMGGDRNVERLDLEPLPPEAVEAQVRAILRSEPPPGVLRELVRRSGGIPFFLEELLEETRSGAGAGPPSSVRMAVDARCARLSSSARAIVHTLAAAGAALPAEVLGGATGLSASSLADALDEGIRGHLVVPGQGAARPAADAFDLRHVLIREAVMSSLAAPRRRELHRALATAIERRPPDGLTDAGWGALLAGQWLLAGDDARALPALLREAGTAEAAHSYATADSVYEAALEVWARLSRMDDGTLPTAGLPERLDILEKAAHVASLAGRPDAAARRVDEALAAAGGGGVSGDGQRLARLTFYRARFEMEAGQRDAALVTVGQALAASEPDGLLRARCLILQARLLAATRRYPAALESARLALRIAEDRAERAECVQARGIQAAALAGLGRLDEALRLVAIDAGRPGVSGTSHSLPSRPSRLAADLHGYLDRVAVLERAGDLGAAARVARDGALAARRSGLAAAHGALLTATAARDLLYTGVWDEAAEMLTVEGDGAGGAVPAIITLVRAHISVRRGEWASAESDLGTAGGGRALPLEQGWLATPHLVAAEMATWRRHFGTARTVVREGLAVAHAESETETLLALACIALRVEADSTRATHRRRVDMPPDGPEAGAANWLHVQAALALPDGGTGSPRGGAWRSTAAAELARLEHGPDPVAWDHAAQGWERLGDAYEAAYCRMRLAEALVTRTGDREAARDALRSVRATCERLGARPLGTGAEWLARRARLIDTGGRPLPPPGVGGAYLPGETQARALGLSEREVEVLGLLAEGLSDREIGERLFITTKTAGHHVSHILTKLTVERRGEAAAVAFRMGLTGHLA